MIGIAFGLIAAAIFGVMLAIEYNGAVGAAAGYALSLLVVISYYV